MGFPKANLFILFTCHFLLLKATSKCQLSYPCRNFTLEFPFFDAKDHPECGLFPVHGCDPDHEYGFPRADIGSTHDPHFIDILHKFPEKNSFLMEDFGLPDLLKKNSCDALSYLSPLNSHPDSVSFTFSPNFTIFICFKEPYIEPIFHEYQRKDCVVFNVFYKTPASDSPDIRDIPHECSMVQLPKSEINHDSDDLFNLLSAQFVAEWSVSEACLECSQRGGQCRTYNWSQNTFYCEHEHEWSVSEACLGCSQQGGQCLTDWSQNKSYCKHDKSRLKLVLALSISGGAGVLLLLSITYIICKRKKLSGARKYLRSRNMSSYPSTISDIEGGFYFGIPVFSYTELEEATNKFDPSKELGDGGFGTVYHGNLRDGREVAIKRLYEHNFRRVEQFLNEIKILTALRHPNLVSLYGCTSRTSRELLLVYEYISNGTVADHLHGDRAREAPLTWPIRMNIAIETATALAYLHKSDIIHRDVKTNNILLDTNYGVKVADFGLSRLFPENVTHISTAPQGTPGYVDPEYRQCYQLTDKSDVYSFGVVLIELISSMPAVDVTRHRHEINLASLALDRIQRCAFDELIDPSLGNESDPEVRRMTTTVAELAFRCLQMDKDLRPSMYEVVAFLSDIQGGEDC
ncbi:hypothetical protein ACS0TY_033365 [Phlomoides rotata]